MTNKPNNKPTEAALIRFCKQKTPDEWAEVICQTFRSRTYRSWVANVIAWRLEGTEGTKLADLADMYPGTNSKHDTIKIVDLCRRIGVNVSVDPAAVARDNGGNRTNYARVGGKSRKKVLRGTRYAANYEWLV